MDWVKGSRGREVLDRVWERVSGDTSKPDKLSFGYHEPYIQQYSKTVRFIFDSNTEYADVPWRMHPHQWGILSFVPPRFHEWDSSSDPYSYFINFNSCTYNRIEVYYLLGISRIVTREKRADVPKFATNTEGTAFTSSVSPIIKIECWGTTLATCFCKSLVSEDGLTSEEKSVEWSIRLLGVAQRIVKKHTLW